LKINPIAFDSMGVRSMCTQVITKDVNILIDPGVSLAPSRFRLPPHPIELKRMDSDWEKILKLSKEADVLIITHYHFDHFSWETPTQFKNKILLIKHPTENINFSQKKRAAYFLKQIEGLPKKVEYADGREFEFGGTRIKLSKAVYHGISPKLGYVLEVLIDDGEHKFIHTSDVEGPTQPDQVKFILENKPNLVFLDGPLSYMLYRFGRENLRKSVENMVKIIEKCPLEALVIDHHFLRDLKWKEKIQKVFEVAKKKRIKVQCVAEYLNKPIEMFEARRKELYEKYPDMKYKSKRKVFEE